MTIPHMTLWVMWAKNQMCALIENSTASSELNIQYVDNVTYVVLNILHDCCFNWKFNMATRANYALCA
jgi:hypothetical protein